jgi:hypothetical protein
MGFEAPRLERTSLDSPPLFRPRESRKYIEQVTAHFQRWLERNQVPYDKGEHVLGKNLRKYVPLVTMGPEVLTLFHTDEKGLFDRFYGLMYQIDEIAIESLELSVREFSILYEKVKDETEQHYPQAYDFLEKIAARNWQAIKERQELFRWLILETMRPMSQAEDCDLGNSVLTPFFTSYSWEFKQLKTERTDRRSCAAR